ncbi:MAG: choice-of-anchor tandem repeat GloVer-containing protein [Rhodospirillales bacterium]
MLHAFQGTDGGYPVGGLIKVGGNFYGATQYGGVGGFGGASGAGTVFSVTPAGAETVLYAFSGANDGSGPYAGLIAVGGVLYGTTYFGGGAGNQGTVFRLTLAGAETVLYSFKGHDAGDGSYPAAPLIHVGNALYGTNAYGGVNYQGAVFKVTGFKK